MKDFTVFFKDGRMMIVHGSDIDTWSGVPVMLIRTKEGMAIFPTDAVVAIVPSSAITQAPDADSQPKVKYKINTETGEPIPVTE